MSIKSNLYAEKAFAEHPIGLWTVDDKLDYKSLIDDTYRDVSLWTVVSGSPSPEAVSELLSPFPDSPVFGLTDSGAYSIVGDSISLSSLDSSLGSITVSAFIKIFSGTVGTISFGIKDSTTIYKKDFTEFPTNEWFFVSATFDIPPSNPGIYLSVDSASTIGINGMSAGQWSSTSAFSSLGFSTVPVSGISGISADGALVQAYGLSENDGYALFSENKQLCRSYGLPIVYGTSDSVVVYASNNETPSIIFPAFGLMNQAGKSSEYTLEFWTKIQNSSLSKRRLVGPISSSDGIYIDGQFLGVSVSGKEGYYYVGEWGRPMLIGLVITESSAKLYVNGEEVISISIDNSQYPSIEDSFGNSNDWIGFYAYEDLEEYLIECVAIYPYVVTEILSKRRFVYGQAVDTISSIDSSFGGASVSFDSKFLKNSKSYSYPDTGVWSQGIVENCEAGQYSLASPRYELPSVVVSGGTVSDWISDSIALSSSAGNVATLKPNEAWANSEGYVAFNTMSIIGSNVRSVYGVFEATQTNAGTSTLLKILDRSRGDYLSMELDGNEIVYMFRYNGIEQELFRVLNEEETAPAEIGLGEIFAVGIDIDTFISQFGGSLAAFFGNRSRLSLYVAGSDTLSNTFTGFIHRVGICSDRNFSKASLFFDSYGTIPIQQAIYDGGVQGNTGEPTFDGELDGGFAGTEYAESISEHIATYTLFPNGSVEVFDVATDSYWEDYVPLSRISRSSTLVDGTKKSKVDFIQFNIDYPASYIISGNNVVTDNELIKSYISFQPITSPNKSFSQLPNTQDLSKSMVVVADENWQTTRYEVVDGTIVIPPQGIDTNLLAINIHVEIKTPGVRSKRVSVRSATLIGKAYDYQSPSVVGSKFSYDAVPYKRYGFYSTYWSNVPFVVHKASSPYLYLSSDYGILLPITGDEQTGISVPINESASPDFFVSAINMFINPSYSSRNSFSGQIAEIDFTNKKYLVFAEPDGNGRYRIFISNEELEEVTSVNYFVNGIPSTEAYIVDNQWSSVSIAPSVPMDFSSSLGAIRLMPGMRFGIMSFFRMSAVDKFLYDSTLPATEITESQSSPTIYWSTRLGAMGFRYFGVDPQDLYNVYSGTNRFVVGDESVTRFGNYIYAIYKNIEPVTITISPV